MRLNHYASYPELMGLDLKGVGRSWTACAARTTRAERRPGADGVEARVPARRPPRDRVDKYFLSAISPRPKATPELVKQGILVSAQCGADALTIGHYDGSWMNCLRAIKEGLEEAGIEIRARAARTPVILRENLASGADQSHAST